MDCYRVDIKLALDDAGPGLRGLAARQLGIGEEDIDGIQHIRQSIDARRGMVNVHHALAVFVRPGARVRRGAQPYQGQSWQPPVPGGDASAGARIGSRARTRRPVVVGAGPCGLFAAYVLAAAGLKPLVLERGQATAERVRQVEAFFKGGEHDSESNVLFGDGGAGAFSDGKLTWRGKDARGRYVLDVMARHGAPEDILYMAKPHVGTDGMRAVVTNMRREIERQGGEFINGACVAKLHISGDVLAGLGLADGGSIETDNCILAIGHSARDTYAMLHASGIPLQAKAFAAGLRIEHRQDWLDAAQYGSYAGHPMLGKAEYALTARVGERGVYTFCMCPGGVVIPSVSEDGCLCVNGMSYRARDGENANSAVIVQVTPEDYGGGLGGIDFQRRYERLAYECAGGYTAPVQRLSDFVAGKTSTAFGGIHPSYPRGTAFTRLDKLLPAFITDGIRQALPQFDRKLKGFADGDAVFTGVEMRSSAPVRIPRGKDMQCEAVRGLYPAGEGAGYAGGIVSAAIDGIKAAELIVKGGRAVL